MQSAAELVELGKRASNEGKTEEALLLYDKAVAVSGRDGDFVEAEHSRRHCANLLRKLGRTDEARQSIEAVIKFYRAHGTGTLEMGNTLRIAALVEEAAGREGEARALWTETLALYQEVGVEAGIEECREHLF